MVFVDMDSLQFYQPPSKAGLRSDGKPTTSNLNIHSPFREADNPVALEASRGTRRVLHSLGQIQSQNISGLLQNDSLGSFRTPGFGLNSSEAYREVANAFSKRLNRSWDDTIPLSCQRAGDHAYRPRFRHPLGTFCINGVPDKSIVGKIAYYPIEVDSGDDFFSSDDSGSNTGHKASSATTPPCNTSPGFRSSTKGMVKNTVIGGEDAGGPSTTAMNLQEDHDSSWLDIDCFPDNYSGFEDSVPEDKCQRMGDIQDNAGADDAKDSQGKDGSQEMGYNIHGVEDRPRTEDGVSQGGEDIIVNAEMDGVSMGDGDGSHSKYSHRTGAGVDAEGELNPSDGEVFQVPVHSSPPRMVRRGRGRPPRNRTAITVCNAVWEVTKIAGDEQCGEGRVLKVQAEAWLAEEALPALREVIAIYRGKQCRKRDKRKSICGGQRRSARRKRV